ncbi:hypothetical protein BGW80DRAFT_427780 [Lactifluus volemus]|nr:hypothetical protein BGW80DRAFT_427780 [Lactifluus volemus]
MLLKLEKRRTSFLDRVIKLGLVQIAKHSNAARLARTHQPARNSSTRSGTRPTVSSSVSGPANPRWTSSTCARSKAPACPSRSFASHMPDAFITMRNCGLQSTIDNYNKFGNFV